MTLGDLSAALLSAARQELNERGLDVVVGPDIAELRRVRGRGKGDYASMVALRIAPEAGVGAMELAGAIAGRMARAPGVRQVTAAPPGFVNIEVDPDACGDVAGVVVRLGWRYGCAAGGLEVSGSTEPVGGDLRGSGLAEIRRAVVDEAVRRVRAAVGLVGAGVGGSAGVGCVGAVDGGSAGGVGSCAGPDGSVGTTGGAGGVARALGADVDPEVVRYCLLRVPVGTRVELDEDAITRHVFENPVFCVRFAAARAAALEQHASDLGLWLGDGYDPGLLSHPTEREVLAGLGEFPLVVEVAARRGQPHRITRYLEDLADAYHRFHVEEQCPLLPKGDARPTEAMRSRLWLSVATRVVITNGLGLLGIAAPGRM